MDFLSKVQRVKENLATWQKSWGDNFAYLINDFATENEELDTYNVYISEDEHKDILKYLASIGYLEITQNGSNSPHIIILPKTKPTIRLKSLELIAIEIGELDTGNDLVNFLIECGVDKKLIVYPNTKWRMVYAVLVELACSKNDRDKNTLFEIVRKAVHPLMYGGDEDLSRITLKKFNSWLKYDGLSLAWMDNGNVIVGREASDDEKKKIEENEEKKQLDFLCQPENKEKISLLRKTYQALMGVVELFCRNFLRLSQEEIVELNKHYLVLDRTVWDIIDELELGGLFENYKKYPRPFTNLFSAEKEHDGDISWDVIRREMSARFGEIETLYQRVNASDILAEPDKQKQLNDVMLYLSKLKEKTKEIKKEATIKKSATTKIEITKLPPLQFSSLSEKSLPNIAKTTSLFPVKEARLDNQNYLLEINNGEKIISFKSKKKGKGLEKETKQFKILYHLWDFRWELKDGKVLKKGDFASLDNLMRGSVSESTEAAYKHIQRLNNRFKNEGVAIEIIGEDEKYRLIIKMA